MTISPPSGLLGVQQPRLSNFPAGEGSDGPLAVELAESVGVVLDPWQRLTLDRMLRYRADGKWSCPTCLLVVPRQNGKGEVLVVRMLAGLFLFEEQLITYTAHEFKTAQEHFRRISSLVESSSELLSKVKTIRRAHGSEGIELKSGARLRFLARSKGSGRGFSGDCVILDEAYELPQEALDALMPTMSARMGATPAGPQLWYSSSAGMATSFELRRVRERAMEGSESIGFAEWSAESPDDADAVRQANPGLGIRVSPEFVENEREALSEDGFNRERLGIWSTKLLEREIPADVWEAVQDPKGKPKAPYVFGVDVSPDRSSAAICVCGSGVIEVTSGRHGLDHRPGVGWVVGRVRELVDRWGGSVALDGGGPAASLVQDFEDADVAVKQFGFAEMAVATARLFDGIVEGRVRFVPSDPLDAAVAGAVKKPTGDRFVWDRSKSVSDVTPLVAATLAFGPADPPKPRPRVINLADY